MGNESFEWDKNVVPSVSSTDIRYAQILFRFIREKKEMFFYDK